MKRLLLLTLDFPPRRGGVARYLFELAQFYKEEITVIATPEKGSEAIDVEAGFTVKRQRLLNDVGWPKWLRAFLPLLRFHKEFDVLIVSHLLPLGSVARWYHKLTKKPYIVILHGMDFALARRNAWKQNITRRILLDAHAVIVNSESLAREVLGFVKPRALVVMYPCLSHEIVKAAENIVRDDSVGGQLSPGPLRLLTVARLVPRKGHSHVLDALALLKSEQRIGAFVYTIVGNGPQATALENHVKELGLTREVSIIQNADDAELTRAYKHADIFVMPTEHVGRDIEGFGTVYIEAAAFGLPSVASQLPGVDEAVINNQTGLLIPSSSVSDLADAIERLAADPALRLQLGDAARTRALAEFIPERQFSKLRQLV